MVKIKDIADALPERIAPERYQEALRLCRDELGGNALIFKRVSYSTSDYDGGPQWYDEPPAPRFWAAECRCTACKERFFLGYAPGTSGHPGLLKPPGVLVPEMPDGLALAFVPDTESEFTYVYREGDALNCPNCGATVTLRKSSYFRRPRMYRIVFGEVQTIKQAAVIVYWLISRTVSADGDTSVSVEPFRAVAFIDSGAMRYFIWHNANKQWASTAPAAPCNIAYASSDGGGSFHKKVGAVISKNVPDLSGTPAEKTGLADYIAASDNGGFPVYYLYFWQYYHSVENVVKSGWAFAVDEAFRKTITPGGGKLIIPGTLEDMGDWRQRSPAKILRMSRAEVRRYASQFWGPDKLYLWSELVAANVFAPGQVETYLQYYRRYEFDELSRYAGLIRELGAVDLPKLDRYLDKQHKRHALAFRNGMNLFCDYRRMLADVIERPAQIELWPQDLHAAHDRIIPQFNAKRRTVPEPEFVAVRETWRNLEFSDGYICARLPLSQTDLVIEGHTLGHCVASYAKDHVRGNLIIFIRHARRPERSWYTLNIDTRGDIPREVQLHGYRNERPPGKTLRIPTEVRAFVDDWKERILTPTFREVKASREART